MAYVNGEAPESALAHVDGIHMAPDVAQRFQAFKTWAGTKGINLYVAKPYGGYRNKDEQRAIYLAGATGGSTVRPSYPGFSTHGNFTNGRVDIVGSNNIYTPSQLTFIQNNAPSFGLHLEFPKGNPQGYDPNHFIASGSFAGGDADPIEKENEMELTDGFQYSYGPKAGTWTTVRDALTAALYVVDYVGGPVGSVVWGTKLTDPVDNTEKPASDFVRYAQAFQNQTIAAIKAVPTSGGSSSGGTVDVRPILDAINALPAATVKAIKDAL